jgi:hypothetical protein
MRTRSGRIAACCVVGAALSGGIATAVVEQIEDAAVVAEVAVRIDLPTGDVASVYDAGAVDAAVLRSAQTVAQQIGGVATAGRTGSLGLGGVFRSGARVAGPPIGYLTPVTFAAFPQSAIGWLMGDAVSAVVGNRSVAMNTETAALVGARVGDEIEFELLDGRFERVTVAAVLDRSLLGGTELAMTSDTANVLGHLDDTRVVIWNIDDRDDFDGAIRASGLDTRVDTRVARSWDPRDPDATLGSLDTKLKLGQLWYDLSGTGGFSVHPSWIAANLPTSRQLINATIPVYARCHNQIVDDLRAAFADIAAAGLARHIDVNNANTYGGCYAPRFSRNSGFVSRHTYAMAFDTNTATNCQGCVPPMNCDVVRIFRKHGFAWGGNFREPDGMHFEWVDERRDQIPYASDYCPNIVTVEARTGDTGDITPPRQLGIDVLIAGSFDEHDHGSHD